MKKILFILHLPPPVHGSSLVGKYIKESTYLKSKMNSKFINLSISKRIKDIGKNSISKILNYISLLFVTIKTLMFFNPKLVYISITASGIAFYKDFLICLIASLFSKRLVLHFHNKGITNNKVSTVDNQFYKFLFKRSSVILLSELLFYDIEKYKSKSEVYFCPNGIPVQENLIYKRKNSNKVPKLLFLSNLIESKGVFILLDALKKVKLSGLKFRCDIVGGEGDINAETLQHKISYNKLDGQVFANGIKTGDEKNIFFSKTDIFIFPTFYSKECFPLVLLEAMMYSIPIISTNEGAIAEIIENNKNGFIVEKQNPDVLAEKIIWLIKNPKKAARMGLEGKIKFNRNYRIDVFEKKLNDILNKIHAN